MSTAGRGRPRSRPPQRANNEGSVYYDKSKDRWKVAIGAGDQRRTRSFRDEDEARLALIELRRQHQGLDYPVGTTPTVAELATKWVEKRSTAWAESRQGIVAGEVQARIVGYEPFTRIPADKARGYVEAWLQWLADDGLTWPTIKTYKQHLSTAYLWTMDRDPRITTNPVARAEKPKNVRKSKPKTWLTFDEARRLIAHCCEKYEQWGPFFLTCAMLGLRPGEGAGLRWRHVNLDTGVIHIGEAIKRRGSTPVDIGEVKNRKSRTLTAPAVVLDALRRQREALDLARMVHADTWPAEWDDLVFVCLSNDGPRSKVGHPVHQSTVRSHLTRICREAHIPRLTPYELRHSAASIMLDRSVGVPAATVATMLGTSERMLRDHYGHLMDPVMNDAADAWAEILNPDG